jgi:hypothetical protein
MRGRLPGSILLPALLVLGLTSCTPTTVATTGGPSATGWATADVGEALSTPTPFAPATATPAPVARRLTPPGCCGRPWWSADSSQVFVIDRAETDVGAAVYGYPVDGSAAALAEIPLGLYSPAGDLLALPGSNQWILALPDGSPGMALPGSTVSFRASPDGSNVAWSEGSRLPVSIDRRQRTLWVADVEGHDRRQVARIVGGDLIGWSEDGASLLTTGQPVGQAESGIWSLGLDSTVHLLLEAARPRSALLSPGGRWLAFLMAFTGDAAKDGLWVLSTSDGQARRLESYGSYRWRGEGALLLLPYATNEDGLSLEEVDASTGRTAFLEALPGALENNEWAPSPDGRWVVYRNADDGALWLTPLP